MIMAFRGCRFFTVPQNSFSKPNTKEEYSKIITVQSSAAYKYIWAL